MRLKNLDDLHVLIQVVRGGTLTAAARSLGITPAAASATLKRLEDQLGTRLFKRSTRAMRLTSAGQVLLDYANRAFDLIAEGETQVTADRAELVGILRIAAPSDLARNTLLPWLDEFLVLHPALHLSLVVSDRTLDVVRDEVDMAIRYGKLADSRLVGRLLAVAYPVVAASPAYLRRHAAPIVPGDLADHNCLTFDRGGRPFRLWRFTRGTEAVEVEVRGDRSVDDASLAREWAIAGAGVILKSAIDLRHDLRTGTLVPLLTDWHTEPYPLHALLPSARFVPQRVRSLVDFLAPRFEALESA